MLTAPEEGISYRVDVTNTAGRYQSPRPLRCLTDRIRATTYGIDHRESQNRQ